MTELEYKLMSTIGTTIDKMWDFFDDIDLLSYNAEDKDSSKEEVAREVARLATDIMNIIHPLLSVFNRVEEANKEEWDNLQRAEARIIEQQYRSRKGL